MYNLDQIKSVHLEITSRCQASCPMCVRNIQGGVDNPWLTLEEVSLEQFKEWFPESFIRQLDRLYMCGNRGDPITAKDTLKIFEYLRTVNPNIELGMNTNGSAKSWQFWKGLAKLRVHVRFGIDGLIDTHSLYRIGTDWVKILDNAKLFISAGGEATWDMLVFEHNKHQVDICEELSQTMGFKHFAAKNTARFRGDQLNVLNKDGTTSHILYPSVKSKEITQKVINIQPAEIFCKVQQNKELYINANGDVVPCCWLDFSAVPPFNENQIDYKDKGFVNPNLQTSTLEEIFNSSYFKDIAATWQDSPLKQCTKQCGKVDKFNEQFK